MTTLDYRAKVHSGTTSDGELMYGGFVQKFPNGIIAFTIFESRGKLREFFEESLRSDLAQLLWQDGEFPPSYDGKIANNQHAMTISIDRDSIQPKADSASIDGLRLDRMVKKGPDNEEIEWVSVVGEDPDKASTYHIYHSITSQGEIKRYGTEGNPSYVLKFEEIPEGLVDALRKFDSGLAEIVEENYKPLND